MSAPQPSAVWQACRRFAERLDDRYFERAMNPEVRGRHVVLTGLPRSGTSLLAALIGQLDNVVCLNEVSPTPYLYHFFGRVRRRIERGRGVPNQYDGSGQLTTNTAASGVRTEARVLEVRDRHFVLGQKYTLPYLNRLEALCDAGWPVWVVVRDPRHALRSWRGCPAHWGISRLVPPDKLLAHIPFESPDADGRRVEVWNHYARRIDALRERLQIVRYEDLVSDPSATLERFCSAFALERPGDLVPELSSRNRSAAYPADTDRVARLADEHCDLGLFGYGTTHGITSTTS